jgi:Transcriptional regulator containing an amidase domain and an AraC-type DNA-binding HTH domain
MQLAEYVRFFWFAEGTALKQRPYVHHAFAYTCPEIIFCYKGQFRYSINAGAEQMLVQGIYGQTENFSKVSTSTDFGVFGFYLYPHVLPQLFGLPANELTNQFADMQTLCGKDGALLEEKIMLAANNEERVQLVCKFLEARLRNSNTTWSKFLPSLILFSDPAKIQSVKKLAEQHFLSLRQFERRFKEIAGFSPKMFLRISRFNSVLNKNFQHRSLVDIAYEAGYYDQSHFIHDFQQFSGHNPKEYFKVETLAASDRGTVTLSA